MIDVSATSVFGRVVRDGAGRQWIDVPRRSACQSCGKSSDCGMSILGSLAGDPNLRLPIDGLSVHDGAQVELSCASSGLLRAAFLAYGLPTLGMVGGALAAAALDFGDGVLALSALVGLALGVMTTRLAVARGHMPTLTLIEE